MTPPDADRVSGDSLKIQSKIKQFELLHPVPITLASISMAIIVAVTTIIALTRSFLGLRVAAIHPFCDTLPKMIDYLNKYTIIIIN